MKTPTLAIVCKRELDIRNFVPIAYFEVVATAKVAGGQFQMRHAPQDRVVRREIAQQIADAARNFEGALTVRVDDKRQPVSPTQLLYAKKIAQGKGLVIPDAAKASSAAMSAWIDFEPRHQAPQARS